MSKTHYRLALAVTTTEMHEIADALGPTHPALADAIRKQWLEITNSGVNIFSQYQHSASEPLAGLTSSEIRLLTGIPD